MAYRELLLQIMALNAQGYTPDEIADRVEDIGTHLTPAQVRQIIEDKGRKCNEKGAVNMKKYVEVRTMTEHECMDISTRLKEKLVKLARIIPCVDKDDTVRIESWRLMEEISNVIATYGKGIQTPLKLEFIADRIRKPVSILCSLLEPIPVCKANQDAYALVMTVNSIIEKDILHEDTEPTLNIERGL